MIIQIAAIDNKNGIGKNNQLPWHLPKDLQRFKKLTLHHPIIMGRKTFESLPGILPNRTHIVISSQPNYSLKNPNVILVNSIESALEEAYKLASKIYIIGGGNIFKQTLLLANELEITRVHTEIDADTFYPEIPLDTFQLIYREFHPKDSKNIYDMEFLTYSKR